MTSTTARQTQVPEYGKISPTAKLVAYWRQYSDVPFAHEVAELVHAKEVFEGFAKGANITLDDMAFFAPMIEARYKSMVSAIRKEGIKQVLELASGVSLRGLAMTTDPEMIYVETDLPGISEEKKAIVAKIRNEKQIPDRGNLFFREVNVVNPIELEEAIEPFFTGRPIAIIHEGLFQYLSLPEKEMAARNIHSILKRYGGVWITPDLNTKAEIDKSWIHLDPLKKMIQNITSITERDFRESAFDNDEHVQKFFEGLGFSIEVCPQIDSSFEISALKTVKVPKEILDTMGQELKIWKLRAK